MRREVKRLTTTGDLQQADRVPKLFIVKMFASHTGDMTEDAMYWFPRIGVGLHAAVASADPKDQVIWNGIVTIEIVGVRCTLPRRR